MNRHEGKQTRTTLLLLITCWLPGCCQVQSVAQSFAHWGETRADCTPPQECMAGCPDACVTLQKPHGYLSQGPTFQGDHITGPAAKTAVDRLVEVDEELETLRSANKSLQGELKVAEATIQEQGRAIDSAGTELRQAVIDYQDVRGRLTKWNQDLDSLNAKIRHDWQQQQETLSQFEDDIQNVLSAVPGDSEPSSAAREFQETSIGDRPAPEPAAPVPPAGSSPIPSQEQPQPSRSSPQDFDQESNSVELRLGPLEDLDLPPVIPSASLTPRKPFNTKAQFRYSANDGAGAVSLQPPQNLNSAYARPIQ